MVSLPCYARLSLAGRAWRRPFLASRPCPARRGYHPAHQQEIGGGQFRAAAADALDDHRRLVGVGVDGINGPRNSGGGSLDWRPGRFGAPRSFDRSPLSRLLARWRLRARSSRVLTSTSKMMIPRGTKAAKRHCQFQRTTANNLAKRGRSYVFTSQRADSTR